MAERAQRLGVPEERKRVARALFLRRPEVEVEEGVFSGFKLQLHNLDSKHACARVSAIM